MLIHRDWLNSIDWADKKQVLEAMSKTEYPKNILFYASNELYYDEQMRLAAKSREYLKLLLEVVTQGGD